MCVIHDFWILQFRRHNKRSVSTVLRFSSRRVYLNRTTHRRSHFMQIKSNASLTFLIFLRYFYLQLMICKWILTSHLFMHHVDEMETIAMYRTSHSFYILYYILFLSIVWNANVQSGEATGMAATTTHIRISIITSLIAPEYILWYAYVDFYSSASWHAVSFVSPIWC